MWINTLIAILLLGLWAAPVSEGRGLLGRLRPPVGGLLLRRCPPPSTCKLAGLVQASAQDGLLAALEPDTPTACLGTKMQAGAGMEGPSASGGFPIQLCSPLTGNRKSDA